ncbi:MAG: hypothetical protein K8H84_07360 [Sulfuricella denitrificans]|nr:hypothetical protein [Sulfuricella denitrificans]
MVIKQFAIALDQALNTLIKLEDGWGMADEMLSARAWRLRGQHPEFHVWLDRIFFWDTDHCEECYQIEKQRKQLPEEYQ